jgi:hypothetical protein
MEAASAITPPTIANAVKKRPAIRLFLGLTPTFSFSFFMEGRH